MAEEKVTCSGVYRDSFMVRSSFLVGLDHPTNPALRLPQDPGSRSGELPRGQDSPRTFSLGCRRAQWGRTQLVDYRQCRTPPPRLRRFVCFSRARASYRRWACWKVVASGQSSPMGSFSAGLQGLSTSMMVQNSPLVKTVVRSLALASPAYFASWR